MADRSNADHRYDNDKISNWSHLEPIGTGAKKKIIKSQDKQTSYNIRFQENVDIDRQKRLHLSSESSLDFYSKGEKMVSDLCTIPDVHEGTPIIKSLTTQDKEREKTSGPTDFFLTALDKNKSHDNISNRIVQLAIEACTDAENIAISHHNRPCFKNIHSICAKTRSNVQKADSAVANLHSQGIPWVIKNFIFSFVRILDGWKGVKELLSEKHETYSRIENKYYSENIRECFVQWQVVTENMLAHIYKTFKCLDHGFKLEQKSFTQNYYANNSAANRHQNMNKCQQSKSHTNIPRAISTSPAPYNALQPPWVQNQLTNSSQNIHETQWSNRPGVNYKKIPVLTTSQTFYSSNESNDCGTFQNSQNKCDLSQCREVKPRQSWTITNTDFRGIEGIYQAEQRELYSQLKHNIDDELGKVTIPPIFNSILGREMEIKAKMLPLSHVEKTLIPSMATSDIRNCYMPKNNSCGDTKDDADIFATWGQMMHKERSEFIAHNTHNTHVPNNICLNASNSIAGPLQYFEHEHDECYEISKVYMKPGSYKVPIKPSDSVPPFMTNSLQESIDFIDDANTQNTKTLFSPVVLAPQPKYNLESWPCLITRKTDELNNADACNSPYLDIQTMNIQNSITSDREWEAAKQSAPKLIDSKNEDCKSDTARLYNALGLASSEKCHENLNENSEVTDDYLNESSNIITSRNTQKIWYTSVHNISHISEKREYEEEDIGYDTGSQDKIGETNTRCSKFDQCGNCIKDSNLKRSVKNKVMIPGTWHHAKKKQPLSMTVVKKFETIITKLSQNVESSFIQQDMDISIAPRFYEIVKYPMSLHDIITKLNNFAYTEHEQVIQDFRRIFHNVRIYLKSCPDPTMKKNVYKVSAQFEKLLNEEFNPKSEAKSYNYTEEEQNMINEKDLLHNVKISEDNIK